APLQVVVTSGDPAADPLVPDLVAASDSGRSQTDNITSVTTPTFQLNGQAGEVIQLLRKPGGAPSDQYVVVNSRTGPGTLTDTSGLADGIYDYATRRGGGTPTLPLAVLIDTQAPAQPGTAPDLLDASDTGASNTDDLTNNVNPAFTVVGLERDAIVELLRDGVAVGTSLPAGATGAVTVTDTAGAPNNVQQTYTYTARQVDVPGNASVAGPGLPGTIDPLPPKATVAPDLQPASDSGISNIDNLTAATTPAFTVAGVEPGAVVRLL